MKEKICAKAETIHRETLNKPKVQFESIKESDSMFTHGRDISIDNWKDNEGYLRW
jgi:hypothetical protein